MALREDSISAGAACPSAYEPGEDWLIEWLAGLEEDIARAQHGGEEIVVGGATLVIGTDVGAVQANWLLHRSLPDLGCGQ